MFGLFKSKSEKLIGKIYHLNRELHSAGRNACRQNTTFWWSYFLDTGLNFDDKISQLEALKGDVSDSILSAVASEQEMPFEFQHQIFCTYWPQRELRKSWAIENLILTELDTLLNEYLKS